MIGRINKLITLLLLVGFALYVVLFNSQSVTITIAPNWQITTNGGVIFLSIFACGVVITSIFGIFFGIKSYFRERRLKIHDSQRQAFYNGALRARSFAASADWHRARVEWEGLIKKDPTDMIARLELSRCLELANEPGEALRVLEQARAADPKNIEVLFRAAELHRSQGNRTAAIDNLALILNQGANRRASTLARNLSEELGRYSAALEYNRQLEQIGGDAEELRAVRSRLELRLILTENATDKSKLRESLNQFCKRNPNFIPGLQRLAKLEAELGNIDDAAQYYVKAAKHSPSSALWNEIAKLWIVSGQPDKALAAARTAVKETTGEARLVAELELVRIQIGLQQFEEAKKSLANFESIATELSSPIPSELAQQFLTLKGYYLNQSGALGEAAALWQQLARQDFSFEQPMVAQNRFNHNQAPAARLSTP